MSGDEFRDVLVRFPYLREGLPEHADEVGRIVSRILALEANPPGPPELPADVPDWEHAYWRRRDSAKRATA